MGSPLRCANMLCSSLFALSATLASPVPPPPVVSEAYCTEARADFLGFYLKEDDASGARIGVDLRLAAVAEDCGPEGRGAEHVAGRAGGDAALELCALWVETGGSSHSTRCYGPSDMPRVDVAIAPRQRHKLLAWPRYAEWPDAVAGASASLALESDLGPAAFPLPTLVFEKTAAGAALRQRAEERRCDEPLDLYAGVFASSSDAFFYHFFYGILLPAAAAVGRRADACAAPAATTLYVRRCSFHRMLAEAATFPGAPAFTLVDLADAPPPARPLDVLRRMDAWAPGTTHALLELLERGPRGRDWLRGPAARDDGRCLFQDRAPAPGRRDFGIAGLGDLAAAYANASRCATAIVPDPTGLPLRDQIDAHAGGALLVAPHGAGLVHAAWLSPGACVVELLPEAKRRDAQLAAAAAAFGLRTARVFAESGETVGLPALLDAVARCAAPAAPAWRRRRDAAPDDLGVLEMPLEGT